ncbi:Solute carrier family 15 member 5, partial [Anabarilius grahami]
VVAFPFEDFYINTHNIVHQLEPHEQHILFYTGLVAVALGIGGIRAILCPMAAYYLQGCDRHQLLSFFNWYTDLSVELSSGVGHSHLSEKLLQYKACLRFYDTVERSDTLMSMETVL